ncbi:MAG: geranylgeranyl reductase family protein [Prochlorococcaceae cyanobacterium]
MIQPQGPSEEQRFDLIVVGAGPAGAIAAATAARAGRRVALLEKHRLPRHKPCGGGLPATVTAELAALAPEAISDWRVTRMRHTWNFAEACEGEISSDPAEGLWMVRRPLFDHALVRGAVAAGATLLEGVELKDLQRDARGVRVRARRRGSGGAAAAGADGGGGEIRLGAPHLIGADGANGPVARLVGLRPAPQVALALELEVPHRWDPADPLLRANTLHLEYGALRHGYAWAFPKADHINIGAGLFHRGRGARQRDVRRDPAARERIRAAIEAYAASLGLAERLKGLRTHAHPLPFWDGPEPLNTADGRVLLAGDAAGLINPLFGDGLYHAIRSGRLAASCVLDGDGSTYTSRLQDLLGDDFEAARRLAKLLYGFPRLTYHYGIRHPRSSALAAQLLGGQVSFRGLARRSLLRIGRGLAADLLPGRRRIA